MVFLVRIPSSFSRFKAVLEQPEYRLTMREEARSLDTENIVRNQWDPYPFILLNLLFSTQAAYAAPIIMMAQNRQNERDRFHAQEDFKTNVKAKKEIEELQKAITRIENVKLNKIISTLEEIKKQL